MAAYAGSPKHLSNWMMNEILRLCNISGLSAQELQIGPQDLAEIIRMVDSGVVSVATGKQLIDLVQESGKSPAQIVAEQNLGMVRDDELLREICEKMIKEHPKEAETYRSGKESLLGWFTGQVMRETKGKADAKLAGNLLKELLTGGENERI